MFDGLEGVFNIVMGLATIGVIAILGTGIFAIYSLIY